MTHTRYPWLVAAVVASSAGCVSSKPGKASGACTSNSDCDAGQVCIDTCRQICAQNTDCPQDQVCAEGACGTAEAGAPHIDGIAGNGLAGPDRFRDRLIVTGARFTAAAFTLVGPEGERLLGLEEVSDTRVVALLPLDLQAGEHTLKVLNQSGEDQAPVSLLADPATPEEVLALITQVDGVGSGLDADMLDGLHLSSFALQSDLGGYAPLSAVANVVTTDGGGGVTLPGALSVPAGDAYVGGTLVVGGEIQLATPRVGWLQVMATDWVPSGTGGQKEMGIDWFNGIFKLVSQTNAAYAHPNLPHGATITSFTCRLTDQSSAGDPSVAFYRQAWGGGAQEPITSVDTAGAASVSDVEYAGIIDAGRALVDLQGYQYYLYGAFGNVDGMAVMIRRCRIGYTIDTL